MAVVLRMAEPAAGDERPQFDPDRWNASQIRRRAQTPPEALLAELDEGTAETDSALREADLHRPMPGGAFVGLRTDAAMRAMVRHQRTHLAELERALAASVGE
jgi:hypothetical protein